MFSFSPRKRKVLEFFSNPAILESLSVVPDERDGKLYNKVITVPATNESPLSGLHFSRESMSLRAKLNLGLPMNFVLNPNVSDFASAYRTAQNFQNQVEERLNDIVFDLSPSSSSSSLESSQPVNS